MPTLFLRLLTYDDKPSALAKAVDRAHDGQDSLDLYSVEPESFRLMPGTPFAYWVSERVRQVFSRIDKFESNGRYACKTNTANDDRRYLRCWWEVASDSIGRHRRWVPLVRGGSFSPYFSDFPFVIDWDDERQTYRDFLRLLTDLHRERSDSKPFWA